MNKMVVFKQVGVSRKNYIAMDSRCVDKFIEILKSSHKFEGIEVFNSNTMKLTDLPEAIQSKVKSILKAYNECHVTFEYGIFTASASYGIKSNYAPDHFVCGEYSVNEVYSEDEQRQNFYEVFGYACRV